MKKFFFASCLFVALIFFYVKRHMSIPHSKVGSLQISEKVDEPIYVFALGDTGSGDENQYAVAEAMETRCHKIPNLNGILLLGDLFYMTGVHSLDDEQWEDKVIKPYTSPCLSQADLYPIFGNHDYTGNKNAFIDYSKIHPNWRIPNRFYSVNFSNIVTLANIVKFIAIDSNFLDFCFSTQQCVGNFLIKELRAQVPWKIVLAHHPLSSASKKGYLHNGETYFGYISRFLACNSADLWISGHAHHLEHRQIKNCSSQLFISGGGGGELEEIKNDTKDEMKFGVSSFGFLELEITQAVIKARFFDKHAKKLYETILTK